MPKSPLSLDELAARLRAFADQRDWGRFHTPKNLAMALVGEAGELAAVFQWMTPAESSSVDQLGQLARVRDELADVFIYLVRLADVLGVDLLEAADAKIVNNEERYPVELSRGRADKYTELDR